MVHVPLALLVLLTTLGCAAKPPVSPTAPPPPDALLTSPQTEASPEILAAARSIPPGPDLPRILAAVQYVGEHLAYDASANATQFTRTAADLFRDRTLGGCSEFALAELALLRAMGFPARLALTMNAKWLARNADNPLAVPNGHGFVEVWSEGRWLLVDPTYFAVSDCAGPAGPFLPGNEILLAHAADFQDAGMTSVEATNAILRRAAQANARTWRDPGCRVLGRVDFDYPRAFANLGNVFLDHDKLDLARNLFRKAAELDPRNVQAHLGLGWCFLRQGSPERARASFRRALELDPGNAQAALGLAWLPGEESVP